MQFKNIINSLNVSVLIVVVAFLQGCVGNTAGLDPLLFPEIPEEKNVLNLGQLPKPGPLLSVQMKTTEKKRPEQIKFPTVAANEQNANDIKFIVN